MNLVLYVHLIAMAFWIGGQLALAFAVVPALRDVDPEMRLAIFKRAGWIYLYLSLVALAALVGTGLEMANDMHLLTHPTTDFEMKMAWLAVVIVGTIVHVVAGRFQRTRVSSIARNVALAASLIVVWYAIRVAG